MHSSRNAKLNSDLIGDMMEIKKRYEPCTMSDHPSHGAGVSCFGRFGPSCLISRAVINQVQGISSNKIIGILRTPSTDVYCVEGTLNLKFVQFSISCPFVV